MRWVDKFHDIPSFILIISQNVVNEINEDHLILSKDYSMPIKFTLHEWRSKFVLFCHCRESRVLSTGCCTNSRPEPGPGHAIVGQGNCTKNRDFCRPEIMLQFLLNAGAMWKPHNITNPWVERMLCVLVVNIQSGMSWYIYLPAFLMAGHKV